MNRLSFLVPLVVVLVLASSLDARAEVRAIRRNAEGRRVALVIGNGGYAEVPLKNPVNDARDMAALLKSMGFDVILRENADQQTMEKAINEFGSRLKDARVRLFFYAGHGLQMNNQNYLLPVGAKVESAPQVKYKAVPANFVLDHMDAAPEGVNVVILDACRNNPYRSLFRSTGSEGLATMTGPVGTFIAYATAPGSVAADGSSRNSPYTKHLLANLATPGLDIRDAFDRVNLGVLSDTNKSQHPWVTYSITGKLCLAGECDGGAAPVAAVTPGSADKETVFWQSVEASDDPQMFEAYLQQYPAGAYAALARIKLKRLTADGPPPLTTVGALRPGQEGFVAPDALVLDTEQRVWLKPGATIQGSVDAAHPVRVSRTAAGLQVNLGGVRYKWKRTAVDTASLSPIAQLQAK